MCFGRFLSLRQGGRRRQSESPRCLITNFRPGIGPDQSEWLTLQSHVSVGLIRVIKPRSRCAPVRAYFRTLTSTCRSKSIIVRLKKISGLPLRWFVGIDSMAAVNRCQGFYRLRIYHLTTGAICAPPQKRRLVF